jgi:hypothetical protein
MSDPKFITVIPEFTEESRLKYGDDKDPQIISIDFLNLICKIKLPDGGTCKVAIIPVDIGNCEVLKGIGKDIVTCFHSQKCYVIDVNENLLSTTLKDFGEKLKNSDKDCERNKEPCSNTPLSKEDCNHLRHVIEKLQKIEIEELNLDEKNQKGNCELDTGE